jgi:ABC-type nitrate/sulfonate/bicarbonate transport system permease component
MKHPRAIGETLLVGAVLIGGWQLVANAALVSPVFFPSPVRTWTALVRGFTSGELPQIFAATTAHMIGGWVLASLLGICIGSLIGVSRGARAYFMPTLEIVRPLPASAVIPLAIAFLGLSESMVLAVIVFGALWPTMLATIHGFTTVEPRLYEVSRALGLSKAEVIFKIALPSAVPDILSGLNVGMNVALIMTIVGEMLAGGGGIGQWILYSARLFQSDNIFAGVILIGLLGWVSAKTLTAAETHVLRWQKL